MTADAPVILARDKVSADFCALIEKFGPVAKFWEHEDSLDYLREHGKNIRAMFCIGGKPMMPGLIEALPNLQFICSLASGYEGVPMDLCKAHGIIMANSAGSNADDVADIAVTHMLTLQSGAMRDHAKILDGTWEREYIRMRKLRRSLMESRVGIVGLGAIGQRVADRMKPFGCDIAWWGPRDKKDCDYRYVPSLKDLADWCHMLVVTGRADQSNRHMINQEIIEAVGSEGMIVNISRGIIVDEDALIAALKSGKLGSAGLDVFQTEPTPAARWKDVPNILLTPHSGGAGTYSASRYRQIAVENFDCFFNGKEVVRRVG